MKPIDKKATEHELARLRSLQKAHIEGAASRKATLHLMFCPSCHAPQVTVTPPANEITAICTCCAAILGTRTGADGMQIRLFESGIKPELRA